MPGKSGIVFHGPDIKPIAQIQGVGIGSRDPVPLLLPVHRQHQLPATAFDLRLVRVAIVNDVVREGVPRESKAAIITNLKSFEF